MINLSKEGGIINMIVSGILIILGSLLKSVFVLLPALPTVAFFTNILTFFNNTICKGIPLLCFFIRPSTLNLGLTLASALFIFKHTYFLILWVAKKLPGFNIE